MINELLQGKKVGALLWDQIQDNTSKVEAIQSYDDAWIKKLSDDNMNKIIALETKQSQVNFTEIMQKLERLETEIGAMRRDVDRNEKSSMGNVNPLSL